jgi:hypothetical protein
MSKVAELFRQVVEVGCFSDQQAAMAAGAAVPPCHPYAFTITMMAMMY